MGRHILLLTLTAILGVGSLPSAVEEEPEQCTQFEINSGACASALGQDVVIRGDTQIPGVPGTPGVNNPGNNGEPPIECDILVIDINRCLRTLDPVGRDLATSPITLSDIAAFRPDPGVDHMEPNGWMIIGLDTNFYAEVSQQVHDGTLLGLPASVRFTPVEYHWTYGDGAAASRSTPGGTWQALGVAEFDPTPTSHIYRAAGTYYIDLSIEFGAEYRIGAMPWTPIAGTLTVPANQLVATAGDAKTVLVERECTRNPSGPGC